jgi:RimJ/RimL family protein N-acetyltransferase
MNMKDLIAIGRLPQISINLMLEKTASNDPFYAQMVKNFYDDVRSRHPKLFFVRKGVYGYSLCRLPANFEKYFSMIESKARGNYRKALRFGCEMKRFDFNTRLDDIRDIWQSTPVRQGQLPAEIREGRVRPITHPPSRTADHDYAYFGVFKEGKLVAYAGCLVAGELCTIGDCYGHDQFLPQGVVPLLIIEIARELYKSYPGVKMYGYGTYFGSEESMRHFKRKFFFYPHKANWILSTPLRPLSPEQERLIYRMDVSAPLPPKVLPEGAFIVAAKPRSVAANFLVWVKTWGWKEAIKTAMKVLSGKRFLFGVIREKRVVQFGWLNVGKCRFYPVEQNAIVVETLWTNPEHRGQGLASATIHQGLVYLSQRGYRRFYVDTILANRASHRMIEKAGFSERVAC